MQLALPGHQLEKSKTGAAAEAMVCAAHLQTRSGEVEQITAERDNLIGPVLEADRRTDR